MPDIVTHRAQVRFEQAGSELTAIEIGREGRSPLITALQRALFALGIVVSAYHVRAGHSGLTERLVLQRRDGGAVDGPLSAATKAAILPIALTSLTDSREVSPSPNPAERRG